MYVSLLRNYHFFNLKFGSVRDPAIHIAGAREAARGRRCIPAGLPALGGQLARAFPDLDIGTVVLFPPGTSMHQMSCPLKTGPLFWHGRGFVMSRKRHSDEDILKLLREIEVKL